ncbi:hypothetical protein ASA01S_136_00030 [Aeromonas salmonicida subsp. masoucida NBRC 13784]|nr:hypothetical protein ASA01S_136_00030 [Aeromonas salmonicida subsp. masoucida NBRC 13784]
MVEIRAPPLQLVPLSSIDLGNNAVYTTTTSVTESELSKTAQQGHGKAQYELAKRLAAKPDYPEAIRWMKQAAQQSGPLAADSDIRGEAALQVGRWYG